ncbi:MAG: hypothetical protein WB780_00560 [Candidatus Acidiferrales bacterium]
MSIQTSASTPAGAYSVILTGTSGSLVHSTGLSLIVGANFTASFKNWDESVQPGGTAVYDMTLVPLNGFSDSVSLSASGLPSGATASFSPATVIPVSPNSAISIQTSASTPAGSYDVIFTGTSGTLSRSAHLLLSVGGDFTGSVSPQALSVIPGQSANSTIQITALNNFTGTVAFSASDLPSGISAGFAPTSVSGGSGSTILTVTAANSAPAGTYTLTISGTSGSLVHSDGISLTVKAPAMSVQVLTYHNDVARTGQNLNETILTPSNVNSTSFGKIGFLTVDGLVDAEPLYVPNLTIAGALHNVVFVVTENDSAYAFDADTFAQLWKVSVLGSGETPSDNRGCSQVTPEIGITSTPAIDLTAGAHGTIYLVAMSKNGSNYFQRLHALDISTGAEESASPVTVQATFPNAGGHTTFDPKQYKERAALLLLNGVIYTSWASHCDDGPYTGWVIGYNETTLAQESVIDVTPNGSEGAIWMAGAGLAGDSSGNIYFLDANGTFDDTLDANGFPNKGDYGNAFVKLSTTGGTLAVADYFTMHNTDAESNADEDLGSGGAMLLPDVKDSTGNTWHLGIGAGKDGNIYVVNRDMMGKFNTNNDSAIYQELDGVTGGGVWAMPAYFNGTIYYGGQNDSLKAFAIANAKLTTPPASQTSANYAYPGATPSVSANGTSNGIVWAVQNNGGGVLHAYQASDLTKELYNSNQAASGRDNFSDNKFITPMIANGKVYVGTPTGVVVFGLLQ